MVRVMGRPSNKAGWSKKKIYLSTKPTTLFLLNQLIFFFSDAMATFPSLWAADLWASIKGAMRSACMPHRLHILLSFCAPCHLVLLHSCFHSHALSLVLSNSHSSSHSRSLTPGHSHSCSQSFLIKFTNSLPCTSQIDACLCRQ